MSSGPSDAARFSDFGTAGGAVTGHNLGIAENRQMIKEIQYFTTLVGPGPIAIIQLDNMFFGGYFLKFVGTIIIYLYQSIVSLLLRKKISSFRQIWSKSDEIQQKGIGFIVIMMLLFLLWRIERQW